MNHGDDKSLAFPHKVANQVVDQFPLKILSRKHFFLCVNVMNPPCLGLENVLK